MPNTRMGRKVRVRRMYSLERNQSDQKQVFTLPPKAALTQVNAFGLQGEFNWIDVALIQPKTGYFP